MAKKQSKGREYFVKTPSNNPKFKIKRALKTIAGLPVVDATKDEALVINKRDVTESKKKDPSNCAAALAGRREFNTEVRVHLTRTYVKDAKNKRWIRFVTPQSIQKEIISFDRGASFEPGEYCLKAPVGTQRSGYYHSGRVSSNKNKKPQPHHTTANVRMNAFETYDHDKGDKKKKGKK